MKLAVINNCVPFIRGGAEHLAESLTHKLNEYGHQAELIRIPFRWQPPESILEGIVACRLLRVPEVDRLIVLKFPAYYVPHHDKIVWLLHQFRQAYDLWNTRFQNIPDTVEGHRIREIIVRADNTYLREARKIYTNSRVTSERLKRFNGIDSEVLLPPLMETSHLRRLKYGNYVLCIGRITASKRQNLIVEAMRYVTSDVRLLIAGHAEESSYLEALKEAISRWRLSERIELMDRFISEQEKAALLGHALGCIYIPYDEDSYGYVTLEAYHSLAPVITCTDSGGTTDLVKTGVTGYVVPPDPRDIAASLDALYLDQVGARRMGEAGFELVRSLRISWDRVIEALTQ